MTLWRGFLGGRAPLNGGGETRTLVLSKLHSDHYMLSALKMTTYDAEHATAGSLLHLISMPSPRSGGKDTIPST